MQITGDKIWFSPINVLYHFSRLNSLVSPKFKKTKTFEKAYEANLVAIMLMGVIKEQKQQYWMQIVKDSEGTPDIRTSRIAIDNNGLDIQEVEVVTYESHSTEPIVDFLRKTKLSPKKKYPHTTTILCYVDKRVLLPPFKQIHQNLQSDKSKNSIIILAKTHQKKLNYIMCQVNPNIDLFSTFEVMKESYNKKYRGVVRFQRGSGDKPRFVYILHEKHYPFESLGIK